MSKFQIEQVSEDVEGRIRGILNDMGLENFKFLAVHNPKMKPNKAALIGKISLVDDALRFFANAPDILIYMREDIYDLMSIETQEIALMKLLNGLHYDMAKDLLKIEKENLKEYAGVLRKYGYEKAIDQYRLELSQAMERLEEEKA